MRVTLRLVAQQHRHSVKSWRSETGVMTLESACRMAASARRSAMREPWRFRIRLVLMAANLVGFVRVRRHSHRHA